MWQVQYEDGQVGGGVTVTCAQCGQAMCWLCKEPIMEHDHVVRRHKLLYSSSVCVKTAFQKVYGVSLCSLKPVIIDSSYFSKGYNNTSTSSNGNDNIAKETGFEMYVMEDGFRFDVGDMTAVAIVDDQ